MKVALDTNVLVYAEGWGDAERCQRARELMARLAPGDVVIPVQVLGELQRVLTSKARRTAQQARNAIQSWCDTFDIADTTLAAMQAAQHLTDRGVLRRGMSLGANKTASPATISTTLDGSGTAALISIRRSFPP